MVLHLVIFLTTLDPKELAPRCPVITKPFLRLLKMQRHLVWSV